MESPRLPELIAPDSTTTVDKALSALREAICRGWLPAGSQLKQDNLAEELAVSRIPVREALRLLEAEGLVVFHAHQGAVVSGLSWGEARELHDLRVALESTVLRLAVPLLDRTALDRTAAWLDRANESVEEAWSDDWSFHASLYHAADRPRMLTMIAGLYRNLARYRPASAQVTANRTQTLAEHRALYEACRQRRIDASVDLLVRHIESEGRRLTALMRGLEASAKLTVPA